MITAAPHDSQNTQLQLDNQSYEDANEVARALMALHAGRMGSWSHNIVKDEIWGDQTVASILGLDFDAQPWAVQDFFNVVHPEDIERIGQAVDDAYSGRVPYYDVEIRRKPKRETDTTVWIGGRGQVTERDADGNPLRIIGVNWDATETKEAEERLSLLAAEMDHRVKNAFAVIRALINIGEVKSHDRASFADTLRNQVEAMATAHALSARMARATHNAQADVTLADVIETALGPWLPPVEGSLTKVQVACSRSFTLPPAKIAAFAMLLYELSTNATKYGPLGERGGHLDVMVKQSENDSLTMTWIEKTSEAPIKPASQAGFGDILLEHCANNLDAAFQREFTLNSVEINLTIRKLFA